jgi:hypothetical protein
MVRRAAAAGADDARAGVEERGDHGHQLIGTLVLT